MLLKIILKKALSFILKGQLETRSWEQDGQKKYTTEVVLRPFRGELTMLDSRNQSSGSGFNDNQSDYSQQPANTGSAAPAPIDELEDEIPF